MSQIEELTADWPRKARRDKLYIAIRLNDTAEIERLKAQRVGLSDYIKDMLRKGGSYGKAWYDFSFGLSDYTPEEAVSVIRNLHEELREPIYFSDDIFIGVSKFDSPEVFKCVLDCFDNKRINKNRAVKHIIKHDMSSLLETAEEYGWLTPAKKCDEYIEFAQSNNRTECVAWLLDYKERTFDAEKERKKAEKQQKALLNAAPDSVMMLKKLWSYEKLENENAVKIKRYKGDKTKITIPEKIGKDTVIALEVSTHPWGIPKTCFVSPEIINVLTGITLPNGLVSIGNGVFYGLTGLCDINIPNSVLSIGLYAFSECVNLKSLTLPDSVKEIGFGAFKGCGELEKINIPKEITKIGGYCFFECDKLKEIEIPEGVKIIKNNAFERCKSLESVIIPRGVRVINEGTFLGCEKLTRVELPETVERIDKFAFSGCSSLKEIVIPEGVREICEKAFADCMSLERIVLPKSLEVAKYFIQKFRQPKSILDNSPLVTAVVHPKSFAERYCQMNGIKFKYI